MSGELLDRWAERLGEGLAALPSSLRKEVVDWCVDARARMRARVVKDSGETARSVEVRVRTAPGSTKGQIRITAGGAAKVLEDGGPIVGRPWLAIPLREDVAGIKRPRADAGLFVLRARDGRLFLASRVGGSLELRWKLQRRVQREARPFMRPVVEEGRARLSGSLIKRMRDAAGPT